MNNSMRKIYIIIKKEGIRGLVDHILKKIRITDELNSDIKRYAEWSTMDVADYPQALSKWYYKQTGNILNLDNPKTFNEKLQWLKLYDSTPLKTKLADKYLEREWIKEQIGEEYLVPLLGVWNCFDEIDFSKLPDKFVLKVNQGSGWNLIVTDKTNLNIREEKKKFDRWMSMNFAYVSGLELHYKNIVPKIIAEEYLEDAKGLIDYRFYCFNGEPRQVWVDVFSGTTKHMREVYDMNWEKIPLRCTWPSAKGMLDEKPINFEKMKAFAKKLSQPFCFVRVDFYEVKKKLYMGEMTFIPMSGIGEFEPKEWDEELGRMLALPRRNGK